ncbi:energy transducer TonB [Granulicella sibirica]|uniref:Ferric siderophore transport system, periplasmic binding protein TonB n=1 Tax=Granulicella sibirica TaxID=2479048 RepID=A0A4Q0SVJ7_9BACT|nr:energy transducer TonB [Granulicella sibirica]RXH55053.1 Ferric siderophore transport system, periplasmic binding protein TonB [Granulicella sibirica]
MMTKPLRSEATAPSTDLQFAHFGVLNAGSQSKASFFTSLTINLILAAVILIITAATTKVVENNRRIANLVAPVMIKEVEPVHPKVVPPKLPPTPVVKVDPPKIVVPEVKLPEPPKVPVVHMNEPVPINAPAPPKVVTPPAAPKVVNLARPEAASVASNNPRPTAVALGQADNPIAPSNRPATAAINLGQRGAAGMPASNNGTGPTTVSLGSGSPGSQAMSGNGARAVQGVSLGRNGGTGPMNSTGRNAATAGQVNLGMVQQPSMPKPAALSTAAVRSGPKVLYKPKPDYTAEARALHLEGTVSVRLRVAASGAVTVIGVGNGLGHGLDESAERAVRATRFQPAVDASGQPTDWEGVVNVIFQMAE